MSKRFTFANAVSLLALFVALSGVSYAAIVLPAGSVGSRQLKRDAVTHVKLAANAVTGTNVVPGSLTGADINLATLGKVPAAQVADAANIAQVKIATAAGTVAAGSASAATATCPAGLTILGGGAGLGSEDNELVNDSYPAGATGWTADVFASQSAGGAFTVYAICGSAVATG